MNKNLTIVKANRLEENMRFFSAIRSCVLWRKHLRRYGESKLHRLNQNKIRFALSLLALVKN